MFRYIDMDLPGGVGMASQQLELVAPSGGRVRVALSADRPISGVAAGVRFAGGSYGTGFQIGPRGYHEFVCTYVAPATTRERFLVHGREVVVAEGNDQQSSVATLIGAYHELMTVYAGGMVVRPRAATLLDTMAEQIAVVVRGRGVLSIPGPRQADALVPRHAGARTRHGEVGKTAHADVSALQTRRARLPSERRPGRLGAALSITSWVTAIAFRSRSGAA